MEELIEELLYKVDGDLFKEEFLENIRVTLWSFIRMCC